MIKKFKVEVSRTNEFIVEIDEEIYNEKWREDFAKVFWDLKNTEAIARDIGVKQALWGDNHKEGYGYVKVDGKLWFPIHDKEPAEGLNIIIASTDDNVEIESEEIK